MHVSFALTTARALVGRQAISRLRFSTNSSGAIGVYRIINSIWFVSEPWQRSRESRNSTIPISPTEAFVKTNNHNRMVTSPLMNAHEWNAQAPIPFHHRRLPKRKFLLTCSRSFAMSLNKTTINYVAPVLLLAAAVCSDKAVG